MKRSEGKLPRGAKCIRCREQAEIALPSHHAKFCPECFEHFFRTAVRRGLKRMPVSRDTPVMVAVSGGKDSLSVWDMLNELGFSTKGLYIDLGINEFSETSREAVRRFASERGLPWSCYRLQEEFGYAMPEVRRLLRGKVCSVCGRLKRQFLNRLTAREGYSVLATGHNLDDEAGRLLGNLIGNRTEYVRKQHPYLPSPHPRIPAKMKPLYRLEIKEILHYCRVKGIQPAEAQCPFSRGATSHAFKNALEYLEGEMPGMKRNFLFTYLDKQPPEPGSDFGVCRDCGEPAYADRCGVCNLLDRLQDKREQAGKRAAEG
jgi:uncharacterized protein (TIGR00269 family)